MVFASGILALLATFHMPRQYLVHKRNAFNKHKYEALLSDTYNQGTEINEPLAWILWICLHQGQ